MVCNMYRIFLSGVLAANKNKKPVKPVSSMCMSRSSMFTPALRAVEADK